MKQYKIKTNQSRTKSITYAVISDKLSLLAESIYNLIKSLDGYEDFDLSINQIITYYKNRGIKVGRKSVSGALQELETMGVIYLERQGGGNKSNVYQIDDEKFAVEVDPQRKHNKERAKMWRLNHDEDNHNIEENNSIDDDCVCGSRGIPLAVPGGNRTTNKKGMDLRAGITSSRSSKKVVVDS